MGAAPAEPGDFAGREQPFHDGAIGLQNPALQIGLDSAQALGGQNVQLDRDQRPGLRVEKLVRFGDTRQSITQIATRIGKALDLQVLGEGIVDLGVADLDLTADLARPAVRPPTPAERTDR